MNVHEIEEYLIILKYTLVQPHRVNAATPEFVDYCVPPDPK